ncbi:glycosyltransferase [Paenibacillus sp. LMG 31456]|uniref:Glycosyltransferase n=1 Tax=Paenibacillus foliorum TaxID=2654974 RepID=A0A972K6P2_9BACL|nr:glycosyltransferase family 1 protein [Paenibacillus foliorum]NOU98347.1 glycosyltransferase [Paenibacillus foliorum]
MRFGVDMMYAQDDCAFHGIGNYSFGHMTHLAQLPDVELFMFQPDFRNMTRERYVNQLSQFISMNNLDFFHFPNPMMVSFPDVFWSGELPNVRLTALVHDIIPWVYRSLYLPTAEARLFYKKQLTMLQQMHHVFTNSEYTRQDLVRIGFPPKKITNISGGCDNSFFPLDHVDLGGFSHAFDIHAPYVLAFTPGDFRKNGERLISAFVRAVREREEPWQIVFANDTPNEALCQRLRNLAEEGGIPGGRICFTGRISKSQVLRLYNGAKAVAMPTLYEGFGLPVLEAMQCGTPVLTSTETCMSEVGGDAAVFVDAYDINSITEGLNKVLFDDSLRRELKARGLDRAEQFQWNKVAERTHHVCQQIMETGGGAIGLFELKPTNGKEEDIPVEVYFAEPRPAESIPAGTPTATNGGVVSTEPHPNRDLPPINAELPTIKDTKRKRKKILLKKRSKQSRKKRKLVLKRTGRKTIKARYKKKKKGLTARRSRKFVMKRTGRKTLKVRDKKKKKTGTARKTNKFILKLVKKRRTSLTKR